MVSKTVFEVHFTNQSRWFLPKTILNKHGVLMTTTIA